MIEPTGYLSLPMENLRQVVAHCPSWQSWCRAARDAAAAGQSIYLCAPPAPDDNKAFGKDELRLLRPMAVVLWRPGFRSERKALALYRNTGSLGLQIEADVPEQVADDERDSEIDFLNKLGAVIADMAIGVDQGLGYLVPMSIAVESVKRASLKSQASEGDYFEAILSVEWASG